MSFSAAYDPKDNALSMHVSERPQMTPDMGVPTIFEPYKPNYLRWNLYDQLLQWGYTHFDTPNKPLFIRYEDEANWYHIFSQVGRVAKLFVSPEDLPYEGDPYNFFGEFYEQFNLPKEAAWFFVRSLRIATTSEDLAGGVGSQISMSGPVLTIALRRNAPGVTSTYSDDTYDTEIDDETITRHKANYEVHANQSVLYHDAASAAGDLNSSLFNTWPALSQPTIYYKPSIFDSLWNISGETYHDDATYAKMPYGNTPGKLTFSFFDSRSLLWCTEYFNSDVSAFTRNTDSMHFIPYDRDKLMGDTNIPWASDDYKDLLGIPIYGLGIIYGNTKIPSLDYLKYAIPDASYGSTEQENVDYLNQNQNYANAVRQSQILQTLLDTVGALGPALLNDFYFNIISNMPNIIMSYINEELRIADAEKNFSGFDVVPYAPINSIDREYVLNTQESMTSIVPVRKIYYNVDKDACFARESPFVDVPINKLFKSPAEFKTYVQSLGLYDSFVSVDAKPYMDFDYGKMYDRYFKFGFNGRSGNPDMVRQAERGVING